MFYFHPARIACSVCGIERRFIRLDDGPDGTPAYGWEPCPDHPLDTGREMEEPKDSIAWENIPRHG